MQIEAELKGSRMRITADKQAALQAAITADTGKEYTDCWDALCAYFEVWGVDESGTVLLEHECDAPFEGPWPVGAPRPVRGGRRLPAMVQDVRTLDVSGGVRWPRWLSHRVGLTRLRRSRSVAAGPNGEGLVATPCLPTAHA